MYTLYIFRADRWEAYMQHNDVRWLADVRDNLSAPSEIMGW